MKTQTVFMTGGSGYIGFPTAEALLRKGYRVVIFDHIAPPKKGDILYEKGNICAYTELLRAMLLYSPTIVIHFAAKISVSESEQKKKVYFETNVIGTKNVLEAMQESHCSNIIFTSSAAVYASSITPLKETDVLAPSSYYGETKKEAEKFIHEATGIHSVILRYFNVVGHESIEKNIKLIPSVLRVARGMQKKLILYGQNYPTPDGTAIRDYISLSDVVHVNCAAVAYLEKNHNSIICNIGSGHGVSNLEVVRFMEKQSGKKIPIVYGEPRKETAVSIADIQKANRFLHWKPTSSTLSPIIDSYFF